MQKQYLYSDSSSEEGEEEDELWNPNEMIDQITKTEDKEKKEQMKVELLEKFLDQRRPFLTAKMKSFLNEEGIFEKMMTYVIRLDEEKILSAKQPQQSATGTPKKKKRGAANKSTTNVSSPSPVNQPRPLVTPQTEQYVRRSFNVTEVFVNPSDELDEIIESRLTTILRLLFQSFQPNSAANFYHFEKILDSILARNPVEATKFLLSDNLFWIMFNFLHEQAIVDAVLSLFTCEFPKQSDTIHFYKALVEAKVFEKIGEKIFTKGSTAALPVAEFLVKLIDKLASFEMSGILFIGLVRTPTFVQSLFNVLLNKTKEYPEEQQRAAAIIIRELLLKSGEKMFDQSDMRPLPNMLSAIHDKLHEYSKPFATDLAELLVSYESIKQVGPVNYSSYVVVRPFGLFKFCMMEILADIVTSVPDTVNTFSPKVWRTLCGWFIEYSNNNMFQCLFYKIFEVVVHHNYVGALKIILSQNKFLQKLIDYYKEAPKASSRGFILNLINILRLAADLQPPDGFLRHHLSSHLDYKSLLPSIKDESQRQLKRYQDLEAIEEEDEEDLSLELGSAFARSLGFEQEAPPSAEKKKKKKKKKKGTSTDPSPAVPRKPSSNSLNPPNPAVPKQAVEHLKPELRNPDDDSDPKDSAATWWQSLKGELTKHEKPQDVGADNAWWDSLKTEIEKK